MTSADAHKTKFHALLHDQIRNEFNASHQYIATAVYFDNADLPQLAITEQIVQLASTAREEGDYLGEQFMQWFLKEQVEEVATMTTLLTIADRAGSNLFDLEEFVAREMSGPADTSGAPHAAGGSI
ncbi:MAG: hypothetical protein EOP32_37580 [Rhodococcus sp. (in: high G+C Gram-positive bacteria)]|nr:MAG: hypothetical protein EOP32_37580 [Rhodococcus sp. (in: high G+C Gram-positive bacteria)]